MNLLFTPHSPLNYKMILFYLPNVCRSEGGRVLILVFKYLI